MASTITYQNCTVNTHLSFAALWLSKLPHHLQQQGGHSESSPGGEREAAQVERFVPQLEQQ
jgi:hypothetical protein